MLPRIRRLPDSMTRSHGFRPCAEGLEDRLLLYGTLGSQWVHGSRITYSFAPDGTDVGGISSTWYQKMSSLGISEQVWKTEFRKAAATWQAVTGINLVEVPDDGSRYSVAGNQQNDHRFGDIRIAGIPQSLSILSSTFSPPPFNGGTLAGDIVMNTAVNWSVSTGYDLLSVAIHEFGHSLGMDHSTIYSTAMYAYYTGMKQSLAPDDVAGIRSIYGEREVDPFDKWYSNQYSTTATNITGYINAAAQIRLAGLDITTSSDADWYYVAAPATTSGTMLVAAQSSYLSSLSPRVAVYSSSMQLLGFADAPYSYGSIPYVNISGVTPGNGYYVRVQAANGGPSGNGSYALLINFGSQPIALVAPPNTTVPEQPNMGGGSARLTDALTGQIDTSGLSGISLAGARSKRPGDDSQEAIVRIGDLLGFGSILDVDAKFRNHPGKGSGDRGPRFADRMPGMVDPGMFVVLTGAEIDHGVTVPSDRSRAASRAIDRVLETWGSA